MKKLIVGWVCIFWSIAACAQVETIEECILNTIKSGNVSKDLTSMVSHNCVQKYIKQAKLSVVDLADLQGATLKYLPGFVTTNGSSILPRFEVSLKNNSHLSIVYLYVKVKNKKSGEENIYRLTAERPIVSLSAGVLSGAVVPISDATTFWEEHVWGFQSAAGID
jgi:hypothetical protein